MVDNNEPCPNQSLWANTKTCPSCGSPHGIFERYSPILARDIEFCNSCGYPYFQDKQLTDKGLMLKDEYETCLFNTYSPIDITIDDLSRIFDVY